MSFPPWRNCREMLPRTMILQRLPLILALLAATVSVNAAEEVLNGMAAVVNGEIVTLSQVRELVGAREHSAAEVYQGEELQRKVKEMRQGAINDLIDRALILQEFKKKEFNIPAYIVDDSVNHIIRREFGGDRMAFVKTLDLTYPVNFVNFR